MTRCPGGSEARWSGDQVPWLTCRAPPVLPVLPILPNQVTSVRSASGANSYNTDPPTQPEGKLTSENVIW